MSTEASVAIIVDALEFRRACIASLLGDWASTEEIGLLPLAPEEAHERLRTDTKCRLVILNAGATIQSLPDILAEIKVLRAMAPTAALVVVADREEPDDILAAMQAGAQAYLSNLLAPDLVFRALSFVLHGGTYFPRSLVDKGSFPVEPELEATPVQREEASAEPGRTRSDSAGLTVAATVGEDVVRSANVDSRRHMSRRAEQDHWAHAESSRVDRQGSCPGNHAQAGSLQSHPGRARLRARGAACCCHRIHLAASREFTGRDARKKLAGLRRNSARSSCGLEGCRGNRQAVAVRQRDEWQGFNTLGLCWRIH